MKNYYTMNVIIKAGVPQGAVLSPSLFSIYINDMPVKYNKNQEYSSMFADDLASYFIFKKTKTIKSKIQSYISLIEKWLIKVRLLMAPSKCNYLIFSNNMKNNIPEELELRLLDEKLSINNNPTFLGIRFDQHLSFKNQIEYLKNSCMQRINILKILAHSSWGLSKETLKQLYNSIIRSLLEYSSTIIPRFSTSNLNKLNCIQN